MPKITQRFIIRTNSIAFFILLIFLATGWAAEPATLNLMPVPQKIIPAEGKFRLNELFTISISGQSGRRLYKGVNRMLKRLAGRTGFFFTRGHVTPDQNTGNGDLQIVCQQKSEVAPGEDESYQLNAFFKEMAQLFPDEYMHIGGDENNGKQWDANLQIQQFMKKHNIADNHALQSYFNKRILKILTKYGKKMVGWDEIFQPDMPINIVIQSWRGKEAMIKSARKGYQTILSNGHYIDLIQPTDFHYLNDPLPQDSPLSAEEKKYILGGEATMWAEFVSPETIDSRIWPRTAAIAERLWSPGTVRDVQDMYRRLDVVSFHLEELGLLHKKNYPMMLRRLTNNQEIVPLKNLIDIIEPVKRYKRNRLKKHTSFSPLTRVVDAAVPDAEIARHFRKLVNDYLKGGRKDRYKEKQIKEWLVLWQNNHADLSDIINKSPVLREIESLSRDLSDCSLIALEALKLLSEQKKMKNDWLKPRMELLKRAKKPRGQTELMVVSAFEKLVTAVVE